MRALPVLQSDSVLIVEAGSSYSILPRQMLKRAGRRTARKIYRAVDRSPLGAALGTAAAQRVRNRIGAVTASQVRSTMDALMSAGLEVYLAGGWGIDALLGNTSRPHHDIDIAVAIHGDTDMRILRQTSTTALEKIGFHHIRDLEFPNLAMPLRWMFEAADGVHLDLLPVEIGALPLWPPANAGGTVQYGLRCAEGKVAGSRFPCLSAEAQLALHDGYPLRPVDVQDVGLLCSHLDLPVPPPIKEARMAPRKPLWLGR